MVGQSSINGVREDGSIGGVRATLVGRLSKARWLISQLLPELYVVSSTLRCSKYLRRCGDYVELPASVVSFILPCLLVHNCPASFLNFLSGSARG